MGQAILKRVLDDIKTLELEELQTVEDAIRARLPEQISMVKSSKLSRAHIQAANCQLRETIVKLSVPMGTDNDGIDADLASEYTDNHRLLEQFDREM